MVKLSVVAFECALIIIPRVVVHICAVQVLDELYFQLQLFVLASDFKHLGLILFTIV
jgi:hypothetical protein